MGSLFRLVILLFGIWLILRIIRRAAHHNDSRPAAPAPPADMLRCDYCGVFVPGDEIIRVADKHYCSRPHAEADRRKP